jgi:hypothetical protein
MYCCQLAYRHRNGEVEGFRGVGFSIESSRQDCLRQIRYKVEAIDGCYSLNRVIEHTADLSVTELAQVREDWALGMRYRPDGTPWASGNRV